MQSDHQQQHDLLSAAIDKAVASRDSSREAREFARQYFAAASYQILSRRDAAALADIALAQRDLAQQRKSGEPLVRLTPPPADDATGLARLETICEDMPFVVDSLGIAVRDMGCSVDWSVHPVLRVRRSEDGALCGVESGEEGGRAESFVSMEITPLADDSAYEALRQRVQQTLRDVALAVSDFPAMRQRTLEVAERLQPPLGELPEAWIREARDFAEWLPEHHFTFLGYAFAPAEQGAEQLRVHADGESSLGLLREGAAFADTERLLAPMDELNRYAGSPRLVVVTKAQARSHIHHPLTLDALSIKELDRNGQLVGIHRFIGLFSSDVYIDRPQNIPVIRQKAEEVLRRSRLSPESHSGKKLRDILHQLPRDELFQSSEEELYQLCTGVRALRDRHQLKLFMRRDRYARFYSALVYVPRERYTAQLRDAICDELIRALDGDRFERNVEFPRGESFARLHVVVQMGAGRAREVDVRAVEARLVEVTRTWSEQLREALGEQAEGSISASFVDAFDAGYQQETTPLAAAVDVHYLAQLSEDHPVLPRLVVDEDAVGAACPTELRLYSYRESVALSDILPTLEHF
ncbi:MAG: NAD-glutamate dehydrogenase, partial [Algiphilus sp.]